MKERLLKWVQQIAMTLDGSPHFTALKNGIQATIPATIIGGLLCIITSFPVPDESATGAAASILKGISSLLQGMKAEDAIARMEGTTCGPRPTSCPDQIAQNLRRALAELG